jgi:2-oxoglutarate ferredoxin oxidoreductase subunit delta
VKTKGKIIVDKELCKGCGYCIEACPAGVIEEEMQFNKKGYFTVSAVRIEQCTGCARCAQVCPDIAITVYRQGKKNESRRSRKNASTGARDRG